MHTKGCVLLNEKTIRCINVLIVNCITKNSRDDQTENMLTTKPKCILTISDVQQAVAIFNQNVHSNFLYSKGV